MYGCDSHPGPLYKKIRTSHLSTILRSVQMKVNVNWSDFYEKNMF